MQKIGIFLIGLGVLIYLCSLSTVELYYLFQEDVIYKEFLGIK